MEALDFPTTNLTNFQESKFEHICQKNNCQSLTVLLYHKHANVVIYLRLDSVGRKVSSTVLPVMCEKKVKEDRSSWQTTEGGLNIPLNVYMYTYLFLFNRILIHPLLLLLIET